MDEEQSLARTYDNYVVHTSSESDLGCYSNINALPTLHVAALHFLGAPLWKKTCQNKVRTKNM